MMGPEELWHILHRKPFQPFRVLLKDGRSYDVRHQHLAVVGKTYFQMGIPAAGDPDPRPLYDYLVTLDLPDIDRVETLDPTPSSGA
jgi:hypothetical protein